MHDGKPYNLGLWDTAGQEDYDRLRPLSYPGTDVFCLVYSTISRASFTNLQKWTDEIHHFVGGNTPVVLVGNKSDLAGARRAVQRLEASDYAAQYGWVHHECSALNGTGLADVFRSLVSSAIAGPAGVRARKRGTIDAEANLGRHTDAIWEVVVGDESVLSASRDHTARRWDRRTGLCLQTYAGHTAQVYKVVRVDSRRLATCSSECVASLEASPAGNLHPHCDLVPSLRPCALVATLCPRWERLCPRVVFYCLPAFLSLVFSPSCWRFMLPLPADLSLLQRDDPGV